MAGLPWQSQTLVVLYKLSIKVESGSPHEVKLVEKVLEERFIEPLPEMLMGDKAFDSDPLDQFLRQ